MYIVGMWDQIKVVESATIIYQVAVTQLISNPAAQGGAFKGNEPPPIWLVNPDLTNYSHSSNRSRSIRSRRESHVYKSGSDVKSYFRSKLFDKEVAFERSRMLRGLVNSVVMTTLVGVQGEEERRLNLLSRISLFMKLAAVVLILSIGQKNPNEISECKDPCSDIKLDQNK